MSKITLIIERYTRVCMCICVNWFEHLNADTLTIGDNKSCTTKDSSHMWSKELVGSISCGRCGGMMDGQRL